MPKQFNAECTYNKIFVVQSLNENEFKTGLRLAYDELSPLCSQMEIGLDYIEVKNLNELEFLFATINQECQNNKKPIYPILHFDIHGTENKSGLFLLPSKEIMLWNDFAKYCRIINHSCKNNLVVFMSVCYGFHSILSTKINQLVPFYALIGPEQDVTVGFLKDNIPRFYESLLNDGVFEIAMKKINQKFSFQLSEKLFVKTFYNYLKNHCKGKGKQQRVENLVTKYREFKGGDITNINYVRKMFKQVTKPKEDHFNRYKESFLLSNHPENKSRFNFSFNDILELIEQVT